MTDVIIIEKSGNIFKKTTNNIDKLWTLCNYRNENNFILIHTFYNDNYYYEIYGKEKGRNGSENLFKHNNLFKHKTYYGNFCCIKKIDSKVVNSNLDELNKLIINSNISLVNEIHEELELEEEAYL